MTRRQRQQPTDPADRALHAAQECRAAAREAHEAMRGLTEIAREVKATPVEAAKLAKDTETQRGIRLTRRLNAGSK